MSPKLRRQSLPDGSFIEISVDRIEPDIWRPHGVRYRAAWIQNGECRILLIIIMAKAITFILKIKSLIINMKVLINYLSICSI